MTEGSSKGAIPTTPLVSRVRTSPHTLISSSLTGWATVKVWHKLPYWSCQGVVTAPGHFQFKVSGNLTGQFVAATATRVNYVGFATVGSNGIDQGFLTQTSELSRPIEVR